MDAQGDDQISNYSPLISYCSSKRRSKFSLDEFIVSEILGRLPVKSLIRFKCVCKNWLVVLDKKNRYFIDLHFDRSKSRRSRFLLLRTLASRSDESCLLAAPFEEEGVGNPQILMRFSGEPYGILNIVNGLICFIDKEGYSVCVFNPATRELTPWFKSTIKQQQEVEIGNQALIRNTGKVFYSRGIRNHYCTAFGYDPVSREYKVISFYSERRSKNRKTVSFDSCICEVLTVVGKQQEQNKRQWRRIAAVPPISPRNLGNAVNTNGSIYWSDLYNEQPMIVKFSVGNETFQSIQLPEFILKDIDDKYCVDAMEIDGHFSLLVWKIKIKFLFGRKWPIKNETRLSMYVLYDDADCSDDYFWSEEIFSLPPLGDWISTSKGSILPISGTSLLILTCTGSLSFYLFDWKKKTLSSTKFQVPLSSDLFDKDRHHRIDFYTYVDNILPLN